MKMHSGLIASAPQIEKLCGKLKTEPIIGVDTEFIREKTFYPQLEIIQVATQKDSWLIDAAYFYRKKDQFEPFLEILSAPKTLKILHAGQADQEAIFLSFGKTISPTIDTALAAALCGYGDGIGLANLLKSALQVRIKKGFARTNWNLRPLPDALEEYAHVDVIHLVDLYQKLHEQLNELGREKWASELSSRYEDPKLYESSPKQIAEKLFRSGRVDPKSYPVLLELVKWREKKIRKLNLPKKWLADDSVLIDIASAKPKKIEHLLTFRGIQKGEIKKNGQEVLDAIQKGLAKKNVSPPKKRKTGALSVESARAAELIRCFLNLLATENQIALRHLVASDQISLLLQEDIQTQKDLIDKAGLSKGAADLVGEQLIQFLEGRLGLSVQKRKVKLSEIR